MLPPSDLRVLYQTFMSGGLNFVETECAPIIKRLMENFQAYCFHDMNMKANFNSQNINMFVSVPLHDTQVVFDGVPFPVKCDLGSIAVSEHPIHNVDNTEMLKLTVFVH